MMNGVKPWCTSILACTRSSRRTQSMHCSDSQFFHARPLDGSGRTSRGDSSEGGSFIQLWYESSRQMTGTWVPCLAACARRVDDTVDLPEQLMPQTPTTRVGTWPTERRPTLRSTVSVGLVGSWTTFRMSPSLFSSEASRRASRSSSDTILSSPARCPLQVRGPAPSASIDGCCVALAAVMLSRRAASSALRLARLAHRSEVRNHARSAPMNPAATSAASADTGRVCIDLCWRGEGAVCE
mmetsp:Transcript_390/g.1086  ORF Transcript_390/g.1086 Transcript_390/m.1086 type:complete len:240 (-) Transcript_390:15-734(-)